MLNYGLNLHIQTITVLLQTASRANQHLWPDTRSFVEKGTSCGVPTYWSVQCGMLRDAGGGNGRTACLPPPSLQHHITGHDGVNARLFLKRQARRDCEENPERMCSVSDQQAC